MKFIHREEYQTRNPVWLECTYSLEVIQMEKGQRLPAAIAAAIALVGVTAIYLMDFGPGTGVQPGGITMVTAAAAKRAGATVVPTVQP